MNEIPMLDLFSGIGGFALAAEIANAMADAEQQQDYRERRVDVRGGLHQAAQRDDGEAGSGEAQGRQVQHDGPTGSRFVPIAHSEIEPYACAVYHRHFPDSVCLGAVQHVTRDAVLGRCGVLPAIVCGGFPCQPHSCAGKRKASADERDLWGECARVLGDLRPRYALFENVSGLLTSERGGFFNRVVSDLAALRYGCCWQVVPASAVGAPHRRERVWIVCFDELADRNEPRSQGRDGDQLRERAGQRAAGPSGSPLLWPALSGAWPSRPGEPQHGWEPGRVVANANGRHEARQSGCGETSGRRAHGQPCGPTAQCGQTEPPLGRRADGLPAAVGGDGPQVHNRIAQLKGFGNAIVPEVAAGLLYAILQDIESQARGGD